MTDTYDAPSQLAAAADAVLQTQGTTLEIDLLDAQDAGTSFRITAVALSERLGFDVSYEAVRRWTAFYTERAKTSAA